MVCYTGKSKQLKPFGDISGASLSCIAALDGFIFWNKAMNCNNTSCPLVDISLIPLTQGKFAIVDTADYKWLMKWKWCAVKDRNTYYAVRNIQQRYYVGKYTTMRMHRAILDVPQGLQTDHRNHYGLDNRRCNIRPCSGDQNCYNQQPHIDRASKYKGVTGEHKRWRARIKQFSKEIHIGYYLSEIEAAKAYDRKAKELFGEFAYRNMQAIRTGTRT